MNWKAPFQFKYVVKEKFLEIDQIVDSHALFTKLHVCLKL